MTNVDSGNHTVTFLMTDVEGSTRQWEAHPECMQAALARHDAIAQEVIDFCGGRLIKSRGEGDSLFVVFKAPFDAARAAAMLQLKFASEEWPAPVEIKSRMAIHAGEAEARDNDFYGQVVNRCARLRSIAHGGQVILSEAARLLISALPEPTWSLRDLGSHRLKDLQHPEQVWQLIVPGLAVDFPRLNSLDVALSNLPEQVTSFVGRDFEILRLAQLLKEQRLVTVVGSGGVGKTRLAMQVAADNTDNYADGVWFVDLSSATDGETVYHSIADVVGVREEPQRPILQTLITSLKSKSLLLILDNCEHLISHSSAATEAIIRNCPKVTVLASSREALGIPGESIFRVPSLAVPDEAEHVTPSDLLQYASIQLFVDRVRAVRQDFELDAENAKAVRHLVRMLDGIPFALELAAARVRAMPVQQLAERINDRFRLLTSGSRTALPRRQTLKAMMDWSYNLLNEQERVLLARLSVFVGGWRLEDCEQVCACDPLEDWEILDLLTSLVDKSLVIFGDKSTDGRYRLLESVRQYAGDHLANHTDSDIVCTRHARAFLLRAQQFSKATEEFGASQLESSLNYTIELGNLRAGMDFAVARGLHQEVVDYGLALARHLITSGFYAEANQRLRYSEQAARLIEDRVSLAKLLLQLGRVAWLGADIGAARALYQEAYDLSEADDNKDSMIALRLNLGNIAWAEGEFENATNLYQAALETARSIGSMRYQAFALGNLGVLCAERAQWKAAAEYYTQGVALHRSQGNARGCADALMNLGETQRATHDFVAAIETLKESLEIFLGLGTRHEIGLTSAYLAAAYFDAGIRDKCEEFLADAVQISEELDDAWILTNCELLKGSLHISDGRITEGVTILKHLSEVLVSRGMATPSHLAHVFVTAGKYMLECGRIMGASVLSVAALNLSDQEFSRYTVAAKELMDSVLTRMSAANVEALYEPLQDCSPGDLLSAAGALDD